MQALHFPHLELVRQQERAHQQEQEQVLVLDLAQREWAHQQEEEEQQQQEQLVASMAMVALHSSPLPQVSASSKRAYPSLHCHPVRTS